MNPPKIAMHVVNRNRMSVIFHFLKKPLANRVNRRMDIRMVNVFNS